jgi:KaiC/GvpD/RAD55 family RecA-like ATPase
MKRLYVLFHVVAGYQRISYVDSCLQEVQKRCVSITLKNLVDQILLCSSEGNYPSLSYLHGMGVPPQEFIPPGSESELKVLCKEVIEETLNSQLDQELLKVINSEESYKSKQILLKDIINSNVLERESIQFTCQVEEFTDTSESDIRLGVSDVDEVTHGFQRGSLVSLCGFTSHGKSTLAISCVYCNLKLGKKVLIFSLEVTPRLVMLQLFSRWLFEEKSLSVTSVELMSGDIQEKIKVRVVECRLEFNAWIKDKLVVLDETSITKFFVKDFAVVSDIYEQAFAQLGGLDLVVYDHFNQLELMFQDLGNVAIKSITSAGKTFRTLPVTVGCVQVNREGFKRARSRGGVFDLTSIGDLHEIERSSAYVVFMFTNSDCLLHSCLHIRPSYSRSKRHSLRTVWNVHCKGCFLPDWQKNKTACKLHIFSRHACRYPHSQFLSRKLCLLPASLFTVYRNYNLLDNCKKYITFAQWKRIGK